MTSSHLFTSKAHCKDAADLMESTSVKLQKLWSGLRRTTLLAFLVLADQPSPSDRVNLFVSFDFLQDVAEFSSLIEVPICSDLEGLNETA